jgi:ribosome biogenesis GTPase A
MKCQLHFAGKAAAVGATAGITRSVQNRIKVSENPLVYLLDTPGILTPSVPDIETGLRLALCGKLCTLFRKTVIFFHDLFFIM